MIKQWTTQTDKGDLSELTNLPEDAAIRSRIVSSAENCLGQDCSFYDNNLCTIQTHENSIINSRCDILQNDSLISL